MNLAILYVCLHRLHLAVENEGWVAPGKARPPCHPFFGLVCLGRLFQAREGRHVPCTRCIFCKSPVRLPGGAF